MERTWEEKLRLQKEKDEEERKRRESEIHKKELRNKKAPHLTNLNEDPQLNGKLYYNLQDLTFSKFHIGRQDGEPKPQLILKAVGV